MSDEVDRTVLPIRRPPLLASVVAGGAAGALAGKFARHRVESGTVDATLASAVRKSVA